MKTLKCFMLILVFVAYGSICFCDYTCNDEITLTLKQKGNIITCKGKKVSIPVDFDLKANNPVLQEQLLPAKLIQTVYFELITPTPSERKSIESVIIDDVLFDKSNSFKHNEGTFIIEFITEANKSGNTVKITQISHPPSICNNCPTATEPLNSLLGNIKIQFTPKSTRVHYLSIAIKPNEKFKLCVPQEQNNNKCYECSGETIIMINPVELKDIKFENMQDANPAICIGITAEMHAIVEPQAYSNDVKWESDGFAAIGRAFSINWLTSGRKKIHATLYGCELDKFADAVEIDTLTADNKIACKDTAIKFNVTTKPPNHEDLISWEISDAERSRSHRIGKTVISVMWSVLGPQYATATCGTSKISEYVELCGIDLIAESNELFIDYDILGCFTNYYPYKPNDMWFEIRDKKNLLVYKIEATQLDYFSWNGTVNQFYKDVPFADPTQNPYKIKAFIETNGIVCVSNEINVSIIAQAIVGTTEDPNHTKFIAKFLQQMGYTTIIDNNLSEKNVWNDTPKRLVWYSLTHGAEGGITLSSGFWLEKYEIPPGLNYRLIFMNACLSNYCSYRVEFNAKAEMTCSSTAPRIIIPAQYKYGISYFNYLTMGLNMYDAAEQAASDSNNPAVTQMYRESYVNQIDDWLRVLKYPDEKNTIVDLRR